MNAKKKSSVVVIQGDCLQKLRDVPDKSIQLVCIDPPYNIMKATWDNQWGKVKKGYTQKGPNKEQEYYDWLGEIFALLEVKLKDNGHLCFFHNDFRAMAELDKQVQTKTKLKYKNFIVWNKLFEAARNRGFLMGYVQIEGLRNFQKMAEYVLIYHKDNTWKLKEERTKRGVKSETIAKEILSKNGGMTGWYNNLETGKNYPTEKTIVPITKHLGLTIDDIVPKFRNQMTHHSVWNFEMEDAKEGHLTQKPIALLENIIRHFTDEGDVVLDCFGGSGSLGVAALNTRRNAILIEKETEYIAITEKRIGQRQSELDALQRKLDKCAARLAELQKIASDGDDVYDAEYGVVVLKNM